MTTIIKDSIINQKRDLTNNVFSSPITAPGISTSGPLIVTATGNTPIQLTNFPNKTLFVSAQGNTDSLGTVVADTIQTFNQVVQLDGGNVLRVVCAPQSIVGASSALCPKNFFNGNDAGVRAGQLQLSDSSLAISGVMILNWISNIQSRRIKVTCDPTALNEFIAYVSDVRTLPLVFDETSYTAATWATSSTAIQADIAAGTVIQVSPTSGSTNDFELPFAWLTAGVKVRIFNVSSSHASNINITSGGTTINTINVATQKIQTLMKTSMGYVVAFEGF